MQENICPYPHGGFLEGPHPCRKCGKEFIPNCFPHYGLCEECLPSTEPSPCPRCKSTNIENYIDVSTCFCRCLDCGVSTLKFYYTHTSQGVYAWNRGEVYKKPT